MPEMQLKRRKAMNRVNIKKGKVGRNAAGGYEKISALVGISVRWAAERRHWQRGNTHC